MFQSTGSGKSLFEKYQEGKLGNVKLKDESDAQHITQKHF
jgi:hypothetical protein